MRKTAIIFGITGQDGAYLSKFLLDKDYKVVGVARRSSVDTTERLCMLNILSHDNFSLLEGDVTDYISVVKVLNSVQPYEIYNLAGQTHVGTSFEQPMYTWQVNAVGCFNILEAVRNVVSKSRFYQASTSEMFGNNYSLRVKPFCSSEEHDVLYQNEKTPFAPTSPYAIAKLAAHYAVDMYRKAYGLHASAGILFNHESPLRGENFVTRKITKWLGNFTIWLQNHNIDFHKLITIEKDEIYIPGRTHIDQGFQFPKLKLGNLKAYRDWGHAEDYVRAMWLMLQQDEPDDYVIATGETHSVMEFIREAFCVIGFGGKSDDYYMNFICIDPQFYRPSDVEFLCGDASKARKKLNWKPKIGFKELVSQMTVCDIHGELEV